MRHVFRLADANQDCLTRSQGERVRGELEEHLTRLGEGDRLRIDFSGIEMMSPSFADECIAKLAEGMGAERFRNLISLTGANETIKTLINAVLATRLSMSARYITPRQPC